MLSLAEEIMISALSREVRDQEWVATGTLSPLPAAAAWLAKYTHAPRAEVFIAGSKEWPFDNEWQDLFDLAQQGRIDVFFLSGAQIDREGNLNLMAIGEYGHPRVRLPGGAGSAMLYYMVKRTVLFKTSHDARGLVERVDHVTSPGYTPDLSRNQRPGHAAHLVTPLGIFAFKPPEPVTLVSLHPGVSLAEVEQKTGFKVQVDEPMPLTPALNEMQRQSLYCPVREKLQGVYPALAAKLIVE